MIGEIKAVGFNRVELDFSLTKRTVEEIFSCTRHNETKVVSLHNICPLPEGVSPDRASPDHFSLSSLDEAERRRAVDAAKNTIRTAQKFKAHAVILHTGRVESIRERTRALAAILTDRDKADSLRREMIHARDEKSPRFFDRAITSLDELSVYAKDHGIQLAIENRFYYNEIPSFRETKEIFARYAAGDLYYWHDVGHAEVSERLGLSRHVTSLDAFSGRLAGTHLHDITGPAQDHKAPQCGTFNFEKLLPYIKDTTIKVIEAHAPASAEEIRRGTDYLMNLFSSKVEQ